MTTIDSTDTAAAVERMTAEELLKGLESLAPPEEQAEARGVEKDTGGSMTTAESNVAELLTATGPDVNVIVNGKLVQGKFTAYMARVMEWKARFDAMPADTTEEQWDALGAEMRADLASIEPANQTAPQTEEDSPPKSPWDDPSFSLAQYR